MEEDINRIKYILEFGKKTGIQYVLETDDEKALYNILNELERLQEDNQEWKMMFDVFNEREYRKKYLEEERAKRPKLLYPDADEIYKRYYELKTEIQQLKKGINSLMNSRKKWKNRYYKLKTENSKLKIQNENISRELISRTNKLNDILEERKQLKDKMIVDKMEQFDDYVIYLIESYLEIMGDK